MHLKTWAYLSLFAISLCCVVVVSVWPDGRWLGFVVLPVIFALVWAWKGTDAPPPTPEATKTPPQSDLPAGFGRALLNQMPSPLVLLSETGRLIYANPAAQEIIDVPRIGAHYSTMIRAPAFVEAVNTALEDGVEQTVTFTATLGRERHLEARLSLLPSGVDLGDERQILALIEDRTGDRLTLQARSDFVANASHELRTPLASILGYIETLQGHAKNDPEAREQFLAIMDSQARRMQRLVDDLMSLSRIEMNANVRPETRAHFGNIAIEAARTLIPLASQKDIMLTIELPTDVPGAIVMGDRDQLSQVIVNLLDNAIKYTPKGGAVRMYQAEPDASYPGKIGITVEDDGPGIAREHLPRLTERFYRVSIAQSRDKGGTGLGLAITKHILQRHEGELDIRSTPDAGSRFTIWLPTVGTADSSLDHPHAAE